MHSRSPLLYSRPGTPFEGLPLRLAENTFLGAARQFYVGGLYSGPATVGTKGGWTATTTEAGSGASNLAMNSAGALQLITDNADNDMTQAQYLDQDFTSFNGNTIRLMFFARLSVADADDGEAFFGLTVPNTALIASPGFGIYFTKTETGTDFIATVKNGSGTTTGACGLTLVDNKPIILGMVWVNGKIRFYAKSDPNALSQFPVLDFGAGTAILETNAPAFLFLYPSFAIQTGAADVDAMTINWAFFYEGA